MRKQDQTNTKDKRPYSVEFVQLTGSREWCNRNTFVELFVKITQRYRMFICLIFVETGYMHDTNKDNDWSAYWNHRGVGNDHSY